MKKVKSNFGFSYINKMANFEAFRQVISSSINFLFLKSDAVYPGTRNSFLDGVADIFLGDTNYKVNLK